MNSNLSALAHPLVNLLGLVLLHFLWQGAVIAGLLSLALRFGRHFSASRRHDLACGALLLMTSAPGLTLTWLFSEGVRPLEGTLTATTAAGTTAAGWGPVYTSVSSTGSPGWLAGLTLAWACGVFVLGLRLAGGWWHTSRLASLDLAPLPTQWQERFEELKRRMAIRPPVRIFESLRVHSPLLVGWVRPTILLPVGLVTGLSPAHVNAILLHELAHIRGHDYAINLFQRFVETLLFYHPAVWWVSDQIRRERENRCDDLVVCELGEGRSLAGALLALADGVQPASRVALAAGAGSVAERVRRLLGAPVANSSGPGRRWFWVFLALVLVILGIGLGPKLASPKLYQSTARLRVELQQTSPAQLDGGQPYDPYFLETQLQLMRSSTVLFPVIEELGLAKRWGLTRPGEVMDRLFHRTSARQYRSSSVVEITVAADNAGEAAELANAIAQQYQKYREQAILDLGRNKRANALRRLRLLDDQLSEVTRNLEEFESANADGLKQGDPQLNRQRNDRADDLAVLREVRSQARREQLLQGLETPPEISSVEIIDRAEPGQRAFRWRP